MNTRRIWHGQLEAEILLLVGPGVEEPGPPGVRRLNYIPHGNGYRFWIEMGPGPNGPMVIGWRRGHENLVGLEAGDPPAVEPPKGKSKGVFYVLLVLIALGLGVVVYGLAAGDGNTKRPTIPPPTNVPTGRPKIGR